MKKNAEIWKCEKCENEIEFELNLEKHSGGKRSNECAFLFTVVHIVVETPCMASPPSGSQTPCMASLRLPAQLFQSFEL